MRIRAQVGMLKCVLLSLGAMACVAGARGGEAGRFSTTQPVGQPIGVLVLAPGVDAPVLLMMQADDSVYAPPSPPTENDFVNSGGVNLDLKVTYLDDYVFRGIDRNFGQSGSDLQFDAQVSLNLGKARIRLWGFL